MHVFENVSQRSGNGFIATLLALICLLILSSNCITSAETSDEHHKIHFGKKEKMTTTDPIVEMETNKGTIKIQIFKSEVPATATNFLDLVERGFYNGLSFHRYEPNFVIQGGDPKGNGTGGFIENGRERTIPLEVKPHLKHEQAGMIAMARSSDPNSASSQFYFTLAPASFLDMQYAVFGKVVDGLNVVKELRKGDKMTKVYVMETANK